MFSLSADQAEDDDWRTENCLYDVFSDHNSLSNRTDRGAVFFLDRISLSVLDNPLMVD